MKIIMVIMLAVILFYTAIKVVITRHETRQIFSAIQELKKHRDIIHEEWVRLQLEQSTWANNHRIESISRTQLHMIEPNPHSLRLVLK